MEEKKKYLIEYYTKQNKVVNIDGDKSIDEVFAEICKRLSK